MPTILQSRLADEIVLNLKAKKKKNKKQLVLSSGYSENTATRQVPAVFEQKGVQEALKVLGFDALSAKKVVSSIMNNNKVAPATRLKATDQVFKVVGEYAPEKVVSIVVPIDTKSKEKIDRILGIT